MAVVPTSPPIEILEEMRGRVAWIDRTETGLLLHFAEDSGFESVVERFLVRYRLRHSEWTVTVEHKDKDLVLHWEGPPEVGEAFDRLQTFFVREISPRSRASIADLV